MNKFACFLDNATRLNKEFNIVPLLYGSLGLEVLTDSNLNSDDIDILIPKYYIMDEGWSILRKYLEGLGYVLIDEHEHTFRKDNVDYSYAAIENLDSFAGIKDENIVRLEKNGSKYKLLSLEQYLLVYEASLLDQYRVNVFKKDSKDKEKIAFIKAKLNKEL